MPSSRRTAVAVALLLLAHVVLTAGAVGRLDATTDEPILWEGARAVVSTGDWSNPLTRFQGPLPLYFNQLLTRGAEAKLTPDVLTRARLGMLPFGLLACAVVFLWSRRLFGDGGGLLSLAVFALHPLAIGYGGLIAVDMAHAAATVLAAFLVWRHLDAPSWPRLLAAGVALGAALATKYLAVLFAPVAAACVAWRLAAQGRRRDAVLHVAALAAVALVTLHACYGFLPGFAPGDGYRSELIGGLVGTPAVGPVLRLLPAPFLLGVDYQAAMGAGEHLPYLNGVFAPGHPDYYLQALVLKTPEPVLFVVLLALVGLPRLFRASAEPEVRRAAVLLVAAMAVPFVYLSFFSTLQIGVRYVLPLLPLGAVLLGSAAATVPPRLRTGAAALLVAWLAAETLGQWPNGLGYYNRLAGGPARGFRHFQDSNSDWGQLRRRGWARLEAEGCTLLGRGTGPRLGRLAIYVRERVVPDPEDPARARHWLDAFEPVDHVGAAYLVYEVDREGCVAAAAGADERVRAELALALLGADHEDEALALAADLSADRAAPLLELASRRAARRSAPGDPGAARALAAAWLAAGREDLVLEALATPGAQDTTGGALLAAGAYALARRLDEGVAVLEAAPDLASVPDAVVFLAELYRRTGRPDDGIALLEQHLDDVPEELRGRIRRAIEKLRSLDALWQDLQEKME